MSNILITGASGFLGKEMCQVLSKDNNIWTLGRTPTAYNHIESDLSNASIKLPKVEFKQVIHLAGKAHSYPKTEKEIQAFEEVNYQGTLHLLNALENQTKLKTFVFASTIAVYGLENGSNINELFPTQPTTPYGKSKLNAEKAIIDWCTNRGIQYLILRLPLIAGENPIGNLGAMKKAIQKGYYVRVKGNNAQKSLVLASDIAHLVAQFNAKSGIYHLTDGYNPTFNEIEKAFEKAMNRKIRLNIPLSFLKKLATVGDALQKIHIKIPLSTLTLNKLTSSLTFNDDKAKRELGWKPNSVLDYLSNN